MGVLDADSVSLRRTVHPFAITIMGKARKHHFIPQFYLRQFTNTDEKLYVVEKSIDTRNWPSSTENAGAKRDYHTLDWMDRKADTETIEQRLSEVEDSQASLLKAIVESPESFSDRKGELAEFIALMYFRVPAFRDHIEKQLSSVVSFTGKILRRQGKLPEPPDIIKDLIKVHGDDIFLLKIANWKIIEFMFDASLHSQISDICSSMNLRILQAKEADRFITCDSPIVLFDREYKNHKPYGSSFSIKTIEVSFALSPTLMLLASWDGCEGVFQVSDEEVRRVNWRAIVNAQNYLYMQEIGGRFTEDLRVLCKHSAGFKLDELEVGKGCYFISRNIPVSPENFTELES